jgi:hypothetical protein
MAKKIVKEWATPLLTELDSMIDKTVNSMGRRELRALEVKRKSIMKNLKRSTAHSVAPLETSEQEKPVLQA